MHMARFICCRFWGLFVLSEMCRKVVYIIGIYNKVKKSFVLSFKLNTFV